MSASWRWARSELRARWRSWLVLGLLAGATAGIAAAGVAGARRTVDALPRYIAAAGGSIDTAVLPNDPAFDAAQRAEVAALPEVREALPFIVPFLLETTKPRGLEGGLLPVTPAAARAMETVILEGRHTDPRRADEVVIDENVAGTYGLGIGSTIEVAQDLPPGITDQLPPGLVPPGARSFRATFRVVGISKSVSSEENWSPSSAFAEQHEGEFVGVTNMFTRLRRGDADFERFELDVQEIVGHPVNVERFSDLTGIDKIGNVMEVERDGLLLFALAVVLGGGVLVGQALVRAVTASGAELDTWRAMGADRLMAARGMVLPTIVTAATGVVTAVAVAIALSPRFPIGLGRRYDIDVGVHADLLVIGATVLLLTVAIAAIATGAAWWRVTRGEASRPATSTTARWATAAGFPPALLIGSRLAVEPGRGRRAVPVRSALIGAVVGVLGVVACFTFRVGINDATENPTRSGIVWDYLVAAGPGIVAPGDRATIVDDRAVGAATRALWVRAVPLNGVSAAAFGVAELRGSMPLVLLSGRAPTTTSEIAFAPTTAAEFDVQVGDTVRVGAAERRMQVVGIALMPASSHTDYDQATWMTLAAMREVIGPSAIQERPDNFEDYLLLRWRPGADVAAAERRISRLAEAREYFFSPSELPVSVVDLGHLGTMPLLLAVFFGLLACATVAHALVTTVRRRRYDLAVLRSVGFTRRQSRLAIAWQATLLAAIGIVVGVPAGLIAGRTVWRSVAEGFPVEFVTPLEVVVVLLVVPAALLVTQLLAAGPAFAATRIRPAQTLRTE